MPIPPYMRIRNDGVLLSVHVQPNARASAIDGRHGDRLKLRIASPPVDGKANREVCRFLAKLLGLSKSRVSIAGGERARTKEVLLHDAAPESVLATIRQHGDADGQPPG